MKELKIRVAMSDNSTWDIPLEYVLHRYIEDTLEEHDTHENALVDCRAFFIEHPHELVMWAEANLSWNELAKVAVCTSPPLPNYVNDWDMCEKSLV